MGKRASNELSKDTDTSVVRPPGSTLDETVSSPGFYFKEPDDEIYDTEESRRPKTEDELEYRSVIEGSIERGELGEFDPEMGDDGGDVRVEIVLERINYGKLPREFFQGRYPSKSKITERIVEQLRSGQHPKIPGVLISIVNAPPDLFTKRRGEDVPGPMLGNMKFHVTG